MACFPRLFHRSKNSFNPAEDDNADTVLNDSDSPVQIGRYLRREETPVFSSKWRTSERLKRQQEQHQERTRNGQQGDNINHTNINNNTSNTSNTSNNQDSTSNNNNNKDSTSNNNTGDISPNKQASGSKNNTGNNNGDSDNETEIGNNISHNRSNSNNNGRHDNNNNGGGGSIATAINVNSGSNLNKKFISNKGKLSQTHHNNSNMSSNNNNNATNTHTKLKPVKERRPTALPTEVPHIEEDATSCVGTYAFSANGFDSDSTPATPSPATTPSIKFFIGGAATHEDEEADGGDDGAAALATRSKGNASPLHVSQLSWQSAQSAADGRDNTGGAATPTTTPTTATTIAMKTAAAAKLKFPSTTSNKQRKGPPPTPHDQRDAGAHIPPPPPLPLHTLTTATSSASLRSNRSAKSKASQAAIDRYDFELQSCTISEVLKTSESTAGTGSSHNGRDSGVQVEDPTFTAKDSAGSESPKSHRSQGGLIFARPNLPAKKDVEIKFIDKDEPTRNLIRMAIERNDFLNNYMDKERKEMVIDAMAPAFYPEHSYIIRENDEGSEIYVSEDGYFDVIKGGQFVGSFGPGTIFGELAILYNAKRFASVKSSTPAHVWKIDRETFRKIMVISGSREREENLSFLKSAPFLKDLSEEVLNRIVDLLQKTFYETNTCIVREGEVGNEFFIIRCGTVTIKKFNDEGVQRVVDRRKRGDYFGEQALLNADRRLASVYADAPGTEVLKLDREAFISYLGTIPQLRERPGERSSSETRLSHRKAEFDNEYADIQLTELRKVATLGAGAFGRVDLVAYSDKTFALKIIKKIDVIKQDQVEHVYNEKHVMMKCRSSPFIVELFKTFRNEKFVYLLMEACMGGDVWTVMSQRRFFDEKTARFIAGCVVEAFDYLHSHSIIYRDLKPENLMLTTDGYCKLADFGFAKHIPHNQKTNTFAGTPEYVAPEIILDRGHDRAVDYWALGILVFELLVGKTPFRGQNQIKIYQQILTGIDVIQMPSQIPKSAQGLIKQLCKQLPAERLGYQRKGILDIKRHSWFDSLDWARLKGTQLPSPIKRPIASNTDLQYFGPTGVDHEHDPPDETSGWDIDF